jgi:hypothetical protein
VGWSSEEDIVADQPAGHGENRPDDVKPEVPAAAPAPPSEDGTALTDEQLAKASGGAGAHEMKKSIIQNFPR